MDAAALTCPQCGAAAGVDATACTFCHARLATVACASCFGLVFVGSKHCAHCGATVTPPDPRDGGPRRCPRDCGALRSLTLGSVAFDECDGCGGIWLQQDDFQRLCAEEERQTVVLGPEFEALRHPSTPVQTVRYVPCPVCAKLMNRVNFGKRSGVVVDSCAAHGTWFDADELRRVIEFVRDGGLARAQVHERMRLEEERRLLEVRQGLGTRTSPNPLEHQPDSSTRQRLGGELLALLFGER